ncbi:MAG: hypothetical protein ACXVZH_15785 [Terriglobales bacterium]
MKNDEHEVNQQPQSSNIENPGATTEPVANNNGQETVEPGRGGGGEASEKPTVSSRKIEASRRNGRKGAGPKTAAGKKRVSRNAVKHGFYAKHLLVEHLDGAESQAEYNDWHTAIFKYYEPVGWLEEYWVGMIAVWSWRLRRNIRHESGQIARALAEHNYDLQQSKAADLADPGAPPSTSSEMDAMTDHLFFTSDGTKNQLRKEAMIIRQLNYALAELERLQAARKQKPGA